MTAYLLTNHIFNFLAPAAVTALLLVLLARIFKRFLVSKSPLTLSLRAQAAIVFIVNVCILTAGLLVFKNDGKMASYAAMVLGGALCHWVLLSSWQR